MPLYVSEILSVRSISIYFVNTDLEYLTAAFGPQ